MKYLALTLLGILITSSSLAQGQGLEEIIVTAQMRDESPPGVVLKKPADYLLLEVLVTNDTRDKEQRKKEIYKTLENALKTAGKIPGIELSLVENNYVVPLNKDNYRVGLRAGPRPDTSRATIRVKTSIPQDEQKATALVDKMEKFVDQVTVVGRSELQSLSSVDLSIVSPGQYRAEIIQLFAEDVKAVTDSLGEGYEVIVEGIDAPVQWARSGPLHLSLYIPYTYTVIPKNVNSIMVSPDY